MKNRTPTASNTAASSTAAPNAAAPNAPAPLPAFAPVPRKCARHDGWTPERQRAFIEALADTGSVSRAAAQVNMSTEGAYFLRRQPGADGFRAAWEAALDFGLARMKDIAFERAVAGTLVPVIAGGKLLGYRRIYNDRLIIFCLRHYGQDAQGKRTKIEYFSTRATAGAGARDAGSDRPGCESGASDSFDVTNSVRDASSASFAEASTTTVRTVITGSSPGTAPGLDHSTALIETFDPAALDDQARAEIAGILADCAARRTALAGTPDDPAEVLLAVEQPEREELVYDVGYPRPRKVMRRPPPLTDVVVAPDEYLEPSPHPLVEEDHQYRAGDAEMRWQLLDDDAGMEAIELAVASVKAARQSTASKTNDGTADALAWSTDACPDPAAAEPRDDEAGFSPAKPPSDPAARLPAPSGEGSGGGDLLPQPAAKAKRRKKK